jgi:HSP20 family molecular chaperone IbpA
MITSLFPNRTFDFYGTDSLFEKYVLVENGTITLEVPGFSKKDLTLEVDQKECTMTITGKKEINGKKKSVNQKIKDYRFGNIDLDKIEAKAEDGILTIYIQEFDQKLKETKRQISLN